AEALATGGAVGGEGQRAGAPDARQHGDDAAGHRHDEPELQQDEPEGGRGDGTARAVAAVQDELADGAAGHDVAEEPHGRQDEHQHTEAERDAHQRQHRDDGEGRHHDPERDGANEGVGRLAAGNVRRVVELTAANGREDEARHDDSQSHRDPEVDGERGQDAGRDLEAVTLVNGAGDDDAVSANEVAVDEVDALYVSSIAQVKRAGDHGGVATDGAGDHRRTV